jgi:hypothetical protein
VRLLIAPGDDLARAPVHGRRVWSPRRAGGFATGGLALGLAGAVTLRTLLGLGSGHGPEPAAMASAASGAVAGSLAGSVAASGAASGANFGATLGATAETTSAAAAPASAPSSVTALAAASGPDGLTQAANVTPSAPAPASSGAAAVASAPSATTAVAMTSPGGSDAAATHGSAPSSPPANVAPTVMARSDGAAPLARIRPHLTEDERRQARLQAETLRPGATGPATVAGSASSPAALLGQGPVYALVTPLARNRDDALAQQVLLQGLKAQTPTLVPTQLDVMPSQGRWRVVWWPHPRQQEAEALLKEARARGLKVELIVF